VSLFFSSVEFSAGVNPFTAPHPCAEIPDINDVITTYEYLTENWPESEAAAIQQGMLDRISDVIFILKECVNFAEIARNDFLEESKLNGNLKRVQKSTDFESAFDPEIAIKDLQARIAVLTEQSGRELPFTDIKNPTFMDTLMRVDLLLSSYWRNPFADKLKSVNSKLDTLFDKQFTKYCQLFEYLPTKKYLVAFKIAIYSNILEFITGNQVQESFAFKVRKMDEYIRKLKKSFLSAKLIYSLEEAGMEGLVKS
jgi:hypothetical protein